VRTGYGEEYAPTTDADYVAADLLDAADVIATILKN